jgi:uncharacterized repeat protein (TIGR03803 family)
MRISGLSFLLRGAIAAVVVSCGFATGAKAQTFTTLLNLSTPKATGPSGALIQSINGNYYGASAGGGASERGTVFEVTPSGGLTDVYGFCALLDCADGAQPYSALVLGADLNLYGVTSAWGNPNWGTVFRMTLGGELTTLYTFCSAPNCTDGKIPNGLIRASNGNLYGTTQFGGTNGLGTFFEVTSTGEYRVLYNFCSQPNCADGVAPQVPPIQGINGNLYGTTFTGGLNDGGVVYEISPSGSFKVFYNFCAPPDCADGSIPNGLVQDASGNFYGTTNAGVYNVSAYGTVFKISPRHQLTVLHTFQLVDGAYPFTAVALANDGNLYGTTSQGDNGALQGAGNIFQVTPNGDFTILHSFCTGSNCSEVFPNALFQGTDGVLYGTASGGGTFDGGTVFSLSNNLSPLVETLPEAGSVGARVIILGNNLKGSSSVTFNGVAAAFTVESDTYITTTVSAGATTGMVSVVTPTGTLESNPQFVVTK